MSGRAISGRASIPVGFASGISLLYPRVFGRCPGPLAKPQLTPETSSLLPVHASRVLLPGLFP